MDFYDIDFEDEVLDALDAMNFRECTPIQEKTIIPLMEGRDLIGVAQTGTGKTAAYLLPVLNKLCRGDYPSDAINCVIMAPTRELAQQIDRQLEGFTYFMDVSSVAVYGGNDGVRYGQELKGMNLGADILVATPGRLISHISLGNVDLSKVSFFILDEADRMLDMGFYNDIMTIAKQLPANRQTMLFSATMPEEIRKLAGNLLSNPVQVTLSLAKPADGITQQAYICHEAQKMGIIKDMFSKESAERVILFVSKKSKVREVATALRRMGLNVGEMHSDLTQNERDEIMFLYKSRKIDLLVATDILARGIDIDDIRIVINYDVPGDCDDYIHRVGRTARANTQGRGITLVSINDQLAFKRIENFIGKDIDKIPLPEGLGEAPEYNPKKPEKGNGKGRRGHSSSGRGGKHGKKGGAPKAQGDASAKSSAKQQPATQKPARGDAASKNGAPRNKKRRYYGKRKNGSQSSGGASENNKG
ncbi:MAG: DEAD/DEAH box helicase [Bacteroidaceae bacterium]|nr:DEAD/DEAH box helicase [Bacteroidaceae bacterium]